ncbi:MAG: efflux RND transporter periplasmic adaptor subunit [Betaproteobacteria bacterium HGW-Betaproteobacteria-11]|nr:MAG: efflux RND transporter periplasmic adaptor subunit [Betaproteobacteria bacterium HGW-Betaproteobacteria-11]
MAGPVASVVTQKSVPPAQRKPLYWYDPMAPGQRFDKPGKSPYMDMDLVPKYADEGDDNGNPTGVKIDSGVVQNLAIRLARVERKPFRPALEAVANVVFNERKVAVIQARSSGFVERVYDLAPGDVIGKGAPLVDLLLPDWAAAQTEFLAMRRSGDQELAAAARERLKLLGMSAELVARIEESGQPRPVITMTTPVGGVIQTLDVRAGMSVGTGMTLAKVNGLESVWLEAALPEASGGQVGIGRQVDIHFAAYPGELFKGRVSAVLPENNADSRTQRVRIDLPNRNGRFRPGMFAHVRMDVGEATSALVIPTEAVIHTGKRDVVILAREGGRFQPVEVETGREADDQTVILKGLQEGQQIVSSGQFLIDSEASLQGVLTRLGADSNGMPKQGAGDAK